MATTVEPFHEADFETLVAFALGGDSPAWEALVERLSRVVWRALSGFNLGQEDRKDAFAASFGRLYERLGTVREPAKLPGWMATTARNEALTILRSRKRDIPTDDIDLRMPATEGDVSDAMVATEISEALHLAMQRLSPSCQQLLALLTVDPPMSYAEISETLGIPHGSIGPTRQRCLQRLRETPELAPFLREADR